MLEFLKEFAALRSFFVFFCKISVSVLIDDRTIELRAKHAHARARARSCRLISAYEFSNNSLERVEFSVEKVEPRSFHVIHSSQRRGLRVLQYSLKSIKIPRNPPSLIARYSRLFTSPRIVKSCKIVFYGHNLVGLHR